MQHVEWLDESGGGRGLMIALAVLAAIFLAMVFRPRPPSPFTSHGAYGPGYGTQSLMFGANPRAGAPQLR